MNKNYKFSDEQFIEAVKNSFSIHQTLKTLGLNAVGAAYLVYHKRIERLQLDTSHFSRKMWNKQIPPAIPIEDYLTNKRTTNSHSLKKKIIRAKLLEEKCANCQLTSWLAQKIPLELDHIDGNNKNNQLTNLRLLCPNCHHLTPTHAGKNKKQKAQKIQKDFIENYIKNIKANVSNESLEEKEIYKTFCPQCFEPKRIKSLLCRKCSNAKPKPKKINWPNRDELQKLVWEQPTIHLAKQLGVSDNAINKKCKLWNIPKPPIGHWLKKQKQ